MVRYARWIDSADSANSYPYQRGERSNPIRLNSLDAVEFATTASAAAGQIQPAQLTNAFTSDSGIPEARMRGFRDFDKQAYEAKLDPTAAHEWGTILVKTKEEALFGAAATATAQQAAADHARLGGTVFDVMSNDPLDRTEVVHFDESASPLATMIANYAALPWVEYCEPNSEMPATPTATVDDPYSNGSYGWDLTDMHAQQPGIWSLTLLKLSLSSTLAYG